MFVIASRKLHCPSCSEPGIDLVMIIPYIIPNCAKRKYKSTLPMDLEVRLIRELSTIMAGWVGWGGEGE